MHHLGRKPEEGLAIPKPVDYNVSNLKVIDCGAAVLELALDWQVYL